MKISCSLCEVCWVGNHLSTIKVHELSIFRESNIIANSYSYLAVLGIENRNLRRASSHVFALIECYPTWNINIEEVKFSMLSNYLSLSVEA